jgi:hypothetical protein
MKSDGDATALGSGSRQSKRERSCWSKTATSPSSTAVRADSFETAGARAPKRPVWSTPFRPISRTRAPILVGQHPVAVDLFLVDPARAMEGRADERRRHRSVLADHRRHFTAERMRAAVAAGLVAWARWTGRVRGGWSAVYGVLARGGKDVEEMRLSTRTTNLRHASMAASCLFS